MATPKATIRELVNAYNDGAKNFSFGLVYHNPHPVGSRLWKMRERGFRRAYTRDCKTMPTIDIMHRAIELSKLHNRPVCWMVGKLSKAA
jgi:hypothetical protein